jgi:hypothetical protein
MIMEHENKRETVEAIQRSYQTVSICELILLSRETLAYNLRELTVSANLGKLRRQLEAGAHQL